MMTENSLFHNLAKKLDRSYKVRCLKLAAAVIQFEFTTQKNATHACYCMNDANYEKT